MHSGPDPDSGRHRIFYALWPPDAVREALAACIARIAEGAQARWVPRDNLHLTLWFVGTVTPGQLQQFIGLPEIAGPPFTLRFTRLRYRHRRQLLWVEPESIPPTLVGMATALRAFVAGRREQGDPRLLAPHVTLGRKVVVASPLPRTIDPIVWPVDAVALVESVLQPAGASYHVLRRWPLCSIPSEGSMK